MLSRDIKDIKGSQSLLLEIKMIMCEIKNTLDETSSRLGINEKNISEFEDIARETIQNAIPKEKTKAGWMKWLMPVIPALWEAEAVDHWRSGFQDQPGQHSETPALLKNTKISRMWWLVSVIPATREANIGELLEPGRQMLQ